jgi:hypothetical protein
VIQPHTAPTLANVDGSTDAALQSRQALHLELLLLLLLRQWRNEIQHTRYKTNT